MWVNYPTRKKNAFHLNLCQRDEPRPDAKNNRHNSNWRSKHARPNNDNKSDTSENVRSATSPTDVAMLCWARHKRFKQMSKNLKTRQVEGVEKVETAICSRLTEYNWSQFQCKVHLNNYFNIDIYFYTNLSFIFLFINLFN